MLRHIVFWLILIWLEIQLTRIFHILGILFNWYFAKLCYQFFQQFIEPQLSLRHFPGARVAEVNWMIVNIEGDVTSIIKKQKTKNNPNKIIHKIECIKY